MKIYLAGPINNCTHEEGSGWRNAVRADPLGQMCQLLDPMDRDYRGKEQYHAAAIVRQDKANIDRSDAILANCWKPSYGTAMEILYARERHKIVVVVSDSGSPWLSEHADLVTDSLESACQYLHLWAMTG